MVVSAIATTLNLRFSLPNLRRLLQRLSTLLPGQRGRQIPEFGLHFGGIGYNIGDLLSKEFAIPLAKPVNGHLERSY